VAFSEDEKINMPPNHSDVINITTKETAVNGK